MRVALALLVVAALSAVARPAAAYVWMIRHGYGGCRTCHTDPSGGETLTRYGRAQSDLLLRMRYGPDGVSARASEAPGPTAHSFDAFDEDEPPAPAPAPAPAPEPEPEATGPNATSGVLWGLFDEPEWMALGGSLRSATTLRNGELRYFPMQADMYGQLAFGAFRVGGSVGAARVKRGSPHGRAAQVTTNQDGINLVSRTHWLGLEVDERGELLLRAGRLNLPYGLRTSEHVLWVREATRTDRESDQQHGAALSYSGSVLRAELMGIAGNYQMSPDRYRERGYSAYVELRASRSLAAGASSLLTHAEADRITREAGGILRGAQGVFARFVAARPVVVLLEANGLYASRRDLGYVGLAQVDVEPLQGLHFGATGEVLDLGHAERRSAATGEPVPRSPGAGEPRLGGWLTADWFFLPHCELRVDAIFRTQEPFTLLGQLHVFL